MSELQDGALQSEAEFEAAVARSIPAAPNSPANDATVAASARPHYLRKPTDRPGVFSRARS